MNNAWLPPGSATVDKGEPTATEIAKLQFRLAPAEENRINDVLDDSLARYAKLTADTSLLDEHVTTVSRFMRDNGWDTPLTEVFHSDDETPAATSARPAPESNRLLRFRRAHQFHLAR